MISSKGMVATVGKLKARIDSSELVVRLSESQARPGRLYAVGVVTRTKQPSIPAKPDDDAIFCALSVIDEE